MTHNNTSAVCLIETLETRLGSLATEETRRLSREIYKIEALLKMSSDSGLSRNAPTVTITVQPVELYRFRYGGNSESLTQMMGSSGTDHVTIRVDGYTGPFLVVVSLINPRDTLVHPHTISGRDPRDENRYKCRRGIIYLIAEESTVILNNISIQRVKKKNADVKTALNKRINAQVDPFGAGFAHLDDHGLIDFDAVRLCFQVFLPGQAWTQADFKDPTMYNKGNLCVTSNVVYEEKKYGDPKIIYISPNAGPVSGGTVMTLWSDEWKTRDHSSHPDVVFEDEQGWSQQAKCVRCHPRKVAIMFEAPEHPNYKNPYYTNNLKVKVHLRLPNPRGGGVVKSQPAFVDYLPNSFWQSIPPADYILQKKAKTMTWKQFTTKSQIDESNESPCTSGDWKERPQPSSAQKSLANNNSNGKCTKDECSIHPMSTDDLEQKETKDFIPSDWINQYCKEIEDFNSQCPPSNGECSNVSNGLRHLNSHDQALPNGISTNTNDLLVGAEGNIINSDEIKEFIIQMEDEYGVI